MTRARCSRLFTASHAYAEDLGDLGGRQSLDVPKDEHLTIHRLQIVDRCVQGLREFVLAGLFVRSVLFRRDSSRLVGVERNEFPGGSGALAPLLDAEASGDREEPRR
jgi:hypothetical protein